MNSYIEQQITHCIEKINENANRKGEGSSAQWHYWQGALRAYQSISECAEEMTVTAE